MYRYLNQHSPHGYIFLFLIICALYFFKGNEINSAEAENLVQSERWLSGKAIYQSVWSAEGPFTLGLYAMFHKLAGNHIIPAIRIFTALFIFLTALFVNNLFYSLNVFGIFTLLPAFFFIILSPSPAASLFLNRELISSSLLSFFLYMILRLPLSKSQIRDSFIIGILLSVLALLRPSLIVFLLMIFFVSGSAKMWDKKDIFSFLSGCLLTLVFSVLVFFPLGSIDDFFRQTILYRFYLLKERIKLQGTGNMHSLFMIFLNPGIFLLLGLTGIILFQKDFYKQSIFLRRTHSIILFSFILCVISSAMEPEGLTRKVLIGSLPSVVYLLTMFFLKLRWKKIRTVLLLITLLIPFSGPLRITATDPYLHAEARQKILIKNVRELRKFVSEHTFSFERILILDHTPEYYILLGREASTKYSAFRIAEYYLDSSRDSYGKTEPISPEELSDLYSEFSCEKPALVVDPYGIFEVMKKGIPLVLAPYKRYSINNTGVYVYDK